MKINEMYASLGVSAAVYEYGEKVLEGLRERFAAIDRTAEYNQAKVLRAMHEHRIDAACFAATTGYGYDDMGREKLEKVYASTFGTEAALVRPQITCGTHALTIALSANLLPGDELLSPVGAPYDTLEEVIGIRPSKCSLMEYGVRYRQADLLPDGSFDYDAIRAAINEKTKLITIQRSKGYATRPSYSVEQIGELIAFCKRCKPDVICMVDNCYGEFVEPREPSDVGADMIVGSLIKNPGGGLAPIGGYICGRADLVERCAYRLSAPGLGQEVGANLGILPSFYQGFFLAPTVVAGALKRASTRHSASAASRTRPSRATTSFRRWNSAPRSGCSHSARAFRRLRRSTATSRPCRGPCRAMTPRSSWRQVRSCRARPSSFPPTAPSARPTQSISRAA